jgi:hypothetical protein
MSGYQRQMFLPQNSSQSVDPSDVQRALLDASDARYSNEGRRRVAQGGGAFR